MIKTGYRVGGKLLIACACLLVVFRITVNMLPFKSLIPADLQYENASIVWEGWEPGIKVRQVMLPSISTTIRNFTIIVDWPRSLLNWEWRLKKIHIRGLNADVPMTGASQHLLDLDTWHEAQALLKKHWRRCPLVIIREANIAHLKGLRLKLHFGDELTIRGAGQLSSSEALEFNFGVSLKDWQSPEIDGLLYVNIFGLPLKETVAFLPQIGLPEIIEGKTTFEAWAYLRDNEPTRGAIQFEGFHWLVKADETQKQLDYLDGTFGFLNQEDALDIWGRNFHFIEPGESRIALHETTPTTFKLNIRKDNVEFMAGALQLDDWRPFLSSLVFLPKPLKTIIDDYNPEGYVDFLHVQVDDHYQPCFVKGKVNQLNIASIDYPGFSDLNATFVYRDKNGRLAIEGDALTLTQTKSDTKIPIQAPKALIAWQENHHDNRSIWIDHFKGEIEHAPFELRGKLMMGENPEVALIAKMDVLSIQSLLHYLPQSHLPPVFYGWLTKSLSEGTLKQIEGKLVGPWKAFPFAKDEGEFSIQAEFEKSSLDYSPQWPKLTGLNGKLYFEQNAFKIKVDDGEIANSQMQATAWIPDLTAPLRHLIIQGDIKSDLEKAHTVIQSSPLSETLGKTLSPIAMSGPMAMSLKLEVPLIHTLSKGTHEVGVRGVLDLKHDNVNIPTWGVAISDVSGEIAFTQDTLHSRNLIGKLWGFDTAFQLQREGGEGSPEIQLNALGGVDVAILNQWLPTPIPFDIAGKTHYSAEIYLSPKKDQFEQLIKITTDLKGVSAKLPQPFEKTASQSVASAFTIHLKPNEILNIQAKYGNRASGAFSFSHKAKQWVPLGGHVFYGVGELAQFRDDGVIKIEGHIPVLNLNEWHTSNDIFNGLEPMIDLDIEQLRFDQFDFNKVSLIGRYNQNQHQWLYRLNSKMMTGMVVLPKNEERAILMDFDRLILNPNKDLTHHQSEQRRGLAIKAKEIRYDGKWLRNFDMVLDPDSNGYHIRHLNTDSYQSTLKSAGSWQGDHVYLNGVLSSKNFSFLLENWGYKTSIKETSGKIAFNLDWQRNGQEMDLATLNGGVDMDLLKGYVYGVDPGIGRVLSLINVDSIQRRLQLDFSDISKNGLVFDKMAGHFNIKQGRVTTEDLFLDGSQARIEFDGEIILPTKKIQASVGVMPNVTGGLPIAVAIASGNPGVGAAVWLMDKLIGRQLKEITRYQYQVSGTWTEPKITERTQQRNT